MNTPEAGSVVSGAFDKSIWSLPCCSALRRLGILLLDLVDEKTLEVSIRLIDLLQLNKHRRFHIWQANGDGLHLTASSRSSFSAIASLQNAEIFRQRLLFGRSTASWSCWEFPSGLRQLTALRIRVILYDLRASVVNKAFILSKIEKDCAMPVS